MALKMKQARRFVNPFTLKNVLQQLEKQIISNCVVKKMVAGPICSLLGINFELENEGFTLKKKLCTTEVEHKVGPKLIFL